MGKLLQINPVVRESTSTGRIMKELGEFMISRGWESYIAYSKGRDGTPGHSSRLIPVGNKADVAWHLLMTRLFDRHGLASKRATRKLIRRIQEIDPDIIQIHNIHGYFLNYRILFSYLSRCRKPVVWTTHDCWLYTGHCYHYDAAGCDKWKTGCGRCPQIKKFPASWIADRSALNYQDKRNSFNSVEELHIVNISRWMQDQMKESFLSGSLFHLIPNGVDLSVFHPLQKKEGSRSAFVTQQRPVALCVASIWSKEKGIFDILNMSRFGNLNAQWVIVGELESSVVRLIPDGTRFIRRTADACELAALYGSATVLLCPTYQDNYPTVIMEAMSCGTPVVAYETGGCPELVAPGTGYIVPQGDREGMIEKALEIIKKGKNAYTEACLERARQCFDKNKNLQDYYDLYQSLASKGPSPR